MEIHHEVGEKLTDLPLPHLLRMLFIVIENKALDHFR